MSAAPALRPLRHADASAVLDAFRSAPDMVRQGDVTTPEQAEAYVRRLTEPGRHVFAVTVADRLVGSVGVLVDEEDRVGWVWYWMHAAHRGRGWMSAAVATVADWALTAGGCERGKFLIAGERVDVLTYGRLVTDPVPGGPRLLLTR